MHSPFPYEQLRGIAHRIRGGWGKGCRASTESIVSEAHIRLMRMTRIRWRDTRHYLAMAATTMRRILVDLDRGECAGKRGGGRLPISLDGCGDVPAASEIGLVEISDALSVLEKRSSRLGRLAELRIFGGLDLTEAAKEMKISDRTARKYWTKARSELCRLLDLSPPHNDSNGPKQ